MVLKRRWNSYSWLFIEEVLDQKGFLMLPYLLNNFEIQKYYQNEPRFNGVYSTVYPDKIKNGAYVINLDYYFDTGIRLDCLLCKHWIMMLLILIVLV